MMDPFDVPISPERLRAVKNLLQEKLTDRQRTLLLAATLTPLLPDEQIAFVVSAVKVADETYNQSIQKLNVSE